MKTQIFRKLIAAGLLAIALACSGGGGGATSGTPTSSSGTTLRGVFTGTQSQNGEFVASIATQNVGNTAGSVSASATMTVPGSSATTLAGTYNGNTGVLYVSGSGFTVTGNYLISHGSIAGTFTGPSGSTGAFTTFNMTSGPSGLTVSNYSGTLTGNTTGVVWIVVGNDNRFFGSTTSVTGQTLAFSGLITGSTFSMQGEDSVGSPDTTKINLSGNFTSLGGFTGTGRVFIDGCTITVPKAP